jgi:hypothetical protein
LQRNVLGFQINFGRAVIQHWLFAGGKWFRKVITVITQRSTACWCIYLVSVIVACLDVLLRRKAAIIRLGTIESVDCFERTATKNSANVVGFCAFA